MTKTLPLVSVLLLAVAGPPALADHAAKHWIEMELCAKIQSSKDYPLVTSDDWFKVQLLYTAAADQGSGTWTQWGTYSQGNSHVENKGRWNGAYTSDYHCKGKVKLEIWGGTGNNHQWRSGKIVVADGKDTEFNLYQVWVDGYRRLCVVGEATSPRWCASRESTRTGCGGRGSSGSWERPSSSRRCGGGAGPSPR